jgi:hypothetical protein
MTAALAWIRAADRHPEAGRDTSLAFDASGAEVGFVKPIGTGPHYAGGWIWALTLTSPAPVEPTVGRAKTRLEAVRKLLACWLTLRSQ